MEHLGWNYKNQMKLISNKIRENNQENWGRRQRYSLPHLEVGGQNKKKISDVVMTRKKRLSVQTSQAIRIQKIAQKRNKNNYMRKMDKYKSQYAFGLQNQIKQKINHKQTNAFSKSWKNGKKNSIDAYQISKLNPQNNEKDMHHSQKIMNSVSKISSKNDYSVLTYLPQLNKNSQNMIGLPHAKYQKQQIYKIYKSKIVKSKTEQSALLLGRSKKERLLLQRLNGKEKQLQQQLKQYHQDTNQMIRKVTKKFGICFIEKNKYLQKQRYQNQKGQANQLQNQHIQNTMKREQHKFDCLLEQIVGLNIAYQQNEDKMKQIQYKIQANMFNQFLKIAQNCIHQQQNSQTIEIDQHNFMTQVLDHNKQRDQQFKIINNCKITPSFRQTINYQHKQINIHKIDQTLYQTKANPIYVNRSDHRNSTPIELKINSRIKDLLF